MQVKEMQCMFPFTINDKPFVLREAVGSDRTKELTFNPINRSLEVKKASIKDGTDETVVINLANAVWYKLEQIFEVN